jgi:NADPH-dependent 2,4-dienoyl-CoA reductase/sulfur reductase-like enzyme
MKRFLNQTKSFHFNKQNIRKLSGGIDKKLPNNKDVPTWNPIPPGAIPAHFLPVSEPHIIEEMMKHYNKSMHIATKSDIIIVGSGMSGLACAYELSKLKDIKVTLFDRNLAPGGSSWNGSQIYNAMVIRKPAHEFLFELGVPFEEKNTGEGYVVVGHAATLTSTLISKCLKNGVNFMGGYIILCLYYFICITLLYLIIINYL